MSDFPPGSRAPYDADRLTRLIDGRTAGSGPVNVVATTGSTNADLADAYRAGQADGAGGTPADRTVLLAEEQVTARGRLGRSWSAPAGAQVIMSVLLRPAAGEVTPERMSELPLLVGVAVAEAAREFGVPAELKWPNDVIVPDASAPHGYRKLAGILVEALDVDPVAVVVGVGLNVSITPGEFAAAGVDAGTSLTTLGARVHTVADRESFAAAELARILEVDAAWRGHGPSDGPSHGPSHGPASLPDLRRRYRELSATLGTRVRAELPDGSVLTGTAVDVDAHGGLVVRTGDGPGAARRTVTAGDVVHLRPAAD